MDNFGGRKTIETKSDKLYRVAVRAVRAVAPDAMIIEFNRTADFLAGQTVAITIPDSGIDARWYSIASAPTEPVFRVLFDLVPDGALTPGLARLRPGDYLLASLPRGSFTDDTTRRSVWIANGTGVAPFLSMVRAGISAPKTLIHGSRTVGRLFGRELFEAEPRLEYVACVTREADSRFFAGRLTAYVERWDAPLDTRYLLCGSAGMIVTVRDILIAKGVAYTDIVAETYF